MPRDVELSPKEGDRHQGHIFFEGVWVLDSICDENGVYYTRRYDLEDGWVDCDYASALI
jgi:hypothetical protein